MRVNSLTLKNFRNIKNLSLQFDEGMNVICGENAQGKTNIIEALWLFSGAKSFRNSKDSSFIMFGEERAETKTEFVFAGVKNDAKIEFAEKRIAFLNEKKLASPANLAGNFNAIVFSPSDLSLVTDGPAGRRKYLDIAIGQLYPNYIEILKNYMRAVTQRNQIIKDYKYDSTVSVMLDVFETEIISSGAKIIEYREKYIGILNKHIPEIYKGLSGGREEIKSVYVTNCPAIMLEERLKEKRREDMFTGVTSVGPHRDDIEFNINGINARAYGSQGQKRSVALTLKLSQAEVIKEITGEYPICLLDDVMSELDVIRQNYILNHIKNWQSFITCCDPSNTERLKEGKIFTVSKGEVI
ncbi:MAG: DNA replication/repair protein RecF [Clostridia bacterium]|nr:DNA replication/repair protein RecF [Clostridia bacterium]